MAAAGVGVLVLCNASSDFYGQTHFSSVVLIAVAMAATGVIGQNASRGKFLAAVLRFAGVCGAVFLLPENCLLFGWINLPHWAEVILVGGLWTAFLETLLALNRLEGFFVQQFLIVPLFCLCLFAFKKQIDPELARLMILSGVIGLGAVPFFMSGISVPLSNAAKTFFCFSASWFFVRLIVSGDIASAVLLAGYPLTESAIIFVRWFARPMTHVEPLFLWENMYQRAQSAAPVVFCVFKRSVLYALLAVIASGTQAPLQPIILGGIISLEMFTRFKSSTQEDPQNMSLRGIFRKMKQDIKTDIANAKSDISLIKEKWSKRKTDKDDAGK